MDAPKCRNIPSCGKRHYGDCAESGNAAQTEAEPAQEHVETEARLAPRLVSQLQLMERLEALEQIVDELLAGKRKRSEYMKRYMRDRRARDGG